jgi:hypothetical protein
MDGDLIPKNNAADSGVLKSAANRYNLPYVAIFRDFGDTQGKSHGLPKKVSKFSVNTAYCQNLQVSIWSTQVPSIGQW